MQKTGISTLSAVEALKRRLGPADKTQIRLLLKVSSAQRLQTMLTIQTTILTNWRTRLRRTHPHLNDLELCKMLFERLRQNG
jgi:hypothetical protein